MDEHHLGLTCDPMMGLCKYPVRTERPWLPCGRWPMPYALSPMGDIKFLRYGGGCDDGDRQALPSLYRETSLEVSLKPRM